MIIRHLLTALRGIALGACVAALVAPPLFAQVRGLSYTIAPVVEQLYFDDNAGLDNATLYGGQLGLGFGRFIELEGIYLLNQNLSNDFSGLSGISDAMREKLVALERSDIALRRYGGKLKVNVPASSVVPFVTVGSGILRFEPEDLNETRTIYLSLGGGVQFSVAGRYAITFGAERLGYRYNLGATFFDDLDLALADLSDRSFNHTLVNNWALRAGIRIYAGGRAPGEETPLDEALREQFSGGLRGLSLRLEPFGGQINFNEDLGYRPEQRVAGLFAGLNLGPFIGMRGFYWRGVESGIFEFDRLQAYGGELRFELTSNPSLAPYLTVGGGYLDVLSGYSGAAAVDEEGEFISTTAPEDEPFIIAGAGAVLPLSESLALNAGARSILLTREGTDNVSEPSDVVASWMFSAGVSFGFGRSRGGAGQAIRSEIAGAEAVRSREEEDVRRDLAAAEARIDSLARLIRRIGEGDIEALREARAVAPPASRDSLRLREDSVRTVAGRADRMVTLPLPEEGELYIRFGDPGGVSIESMIGYDADASEFAGLPDARQTLTAEQIEQIVSRTIREELGAAEVQGAREIELGRIERRIDDRLDALEERMQSQLDRSLAELESDARSQRLIVTDADDLEVGLQVDVRPAAERAVYPFAAFMSGDPNLGIVGLRLDPGVPFFGPIAFQPEIGIGFGAETYAYHVNLDAVYTAGFVERVVSGLRPYFGLGAGMLGFNEKPEDVAGVQFTANARIGTDVALRWGSFFLEYATYDFFEYHRIASGYRVRL